MQIIGESKDGYILSATKDEVANLVGYYGRYMNEFNALNLKVGQEIKVSEIYKQLYSLSFKEQELKEIRGELIKMANTLKLIDPIIPTITVPENT